MEVLAARFIANDAAQPQPETNDTLGPSSRGTGRTEESLPGESFASDKSNGGGPQPARRAFEGDRPAPLEWLAPPVDLRVDALARDVARLLAELEAPGATVRAPRPLRL